MKMEVPANMKCYQYGNIRMFNGDCMVFMRDVPDKHYELAIVDPPYGIGESGQTNKSRGNLAKAKDYGNKDWDKLPPSPQYVSQLKRVSSNQIIWGANHFLRETGPAWIVWDKKNGNSDFADCELAWSSFNKAVRKFEFLWNGMLRGEKGERIHPTQKPVALYRWLLENYAKTGDKILDTHGGSGSIVIACHALGFALDWVELDPDYYEAAVKRFKQYLGKAEEMDGTKFDAPPQLKMFTE